MSQGRIAQLVSFLRAAVGRFVTIAGVLVIVCAPLERASAQGVPPQVQQLFGRILSSAIQQAQIINSARKSWEQVDQQVQTCLITTYNLSPKQLAQNGIRADDPRIAQYVQSCWQIAYDARQRQAARDEAERQAEAAEQLRRDRAQQISGQSRTGYAWLGVTFVDLTDDIVRERHLETTRGAVVAYVYPGSIAGGLGVTSGDVFLSVNGNAVNDVDELNDQMNRIREGKRVSFAVILGKRNVRARLEFTRPVTNEVVPNTIPNQSAVSEINPAQTGQPSEAQPAEASPTARSWYVVRATKSEAGGNAVDTLQAAAKQKIETLCAGDYSITDSRTYDGTGQDAATNGQHEAWIDATAACAAERSIPSDAAAGSLTLDNLIRTPRSEATKAIPGSNYFDTYSEELDASYNAVMTAIAAVLNNRGDHVVLTDRDKGILVTVYPPKWDAQHVEQFFLVVDPESDSQTRLTFKLLSRWRHIAGPDKAEYLIEDHDTVSRKAAEFVESVRRSLRK